MSFDRQLLDYVGNKAAMGGEICLPGVLGGDGSAAFVKEPGLAVSASCKAPEAAWSFVRTLLTEEYQARAPVSACPRTAQSLRPCWRPGASARAGASSTTSYPDRGRRAMPPAAWAERASRARTRSCCSRP